MKEEVFYQVMHKGRGVGFFKTKEAAERCASEFKNNIEGYSYPVEIVAREFLDDNYIKPDEEEGNFNLGDWGSGGT